MSYPYPPIYKWSDDEVIKAMAMSHPAPLAPEGIRRNHGLPKGCSQSYRLRAKLVDMIGRDLVEGLDPVLTHWPKGWRYILRPKGIAYAKSRGWL